jgi:DNA-binding transcriptional MerR regulator
MDKSPDAFRTISEVAEVLETPAHVLRFWESRFPQIRPVKRAGGRRYYRPTDVSLLIGIKRLLHEEGLTIRGVQKILREQGVRHVAGLSGQIIPDETEDVEAALEAALAANFGTGKAGSVLQAEVETAQIVALESALRRADTAPSLPETGEVVALFDAPSADLMVPGHAVTDATPQGEVDPWATLPRSTLPLADAPLAQRLAALPPGAFADHAAVARALHGRLVAMIARLEAAPSRGPN